MKIYKANFEGRLNKSIGECYSIIDYIVAENEEKARLKLYKKYELIHCLSFKEVFLFILTKGV